MTALPQDVVADLRRRVDELEQRFQSALAERDEAIARQAAGAVEHAWLLTDLRTTRDRQAASAEILRAIASTPGDAERPLQLIAETTARLFGASSVTLNIASGDEWARMIRVGPSSQRVGSELSAAQLRIGGHNLPGTVFRENRQIHIPDLDNLDPAIADWPTLPIARAAGARAMAGTPLRREGNAIGALIVHRDRPVPFTAEELALLQSFADQAVIAIENARLFNETREALEQQKASADILSVISNSVADTQPVFDKILHSIEHLFGGEERFIFLVGEDGLLHIGAAHGRTAERARALFPAPLEGTASEVAIHERRLVISADIFNDPDIPADARERSRRFGTNYSMVVAPMLSEDRAIGSILVARTSMEPFSEKECGLLQTFADQAVIAIQNVRLLNETREALERQTATSDILKVIASSPSDVQPVFEAIAERANRLVEGLSTAVYSLVDDTQHLMAFTRKDPEADATLQALFPRPLSAVAWGEQIRNGEIFHVSDTEVELSAQPSLLELARMRGFRSFLLVPLLRDRTPIGLISVTRAQPGTFAAHHVQLLETFADQAVIAIENTRLFNETKEALERQTATADILKVIASSPSDVQPVFEAIAASANRLIGGFSTAVFRFVDGVTHLAAFTPTNPAADEVLKSSFPLPLTHFAPLQMVQNGETVQIADTETAPAFQVHIARARGFRSIMFSPLMSNGTTIGMISVTRTEPGSFADHHVQLLQTFAAQAVIAIENVRLFNETQEALKHQTATSEVLQAIGSSMADTQPVFERILDSTERLFDCRQSAIFLAPGDGLLHLVARRGLRSETIDAVYPQPIEQTAAPRVLGERQQRYFPDVMHGTNVPQSLYRAGQAMGNVSVVLTPMVWENQGVGLISVTREPNAAFNAKELGLLKTFADQAVIAIENARLFEEVQAKTRDLTESLQQQTATADVLKVISRSAFDLQAVFNTVARSALELCAADGCALFLRESDLLCARGVWGMDDEFARLLRDNPVQINMDSHMGRVVLTGEVANIANFANSSSKLRKFYDFRPFNSFLAVPLMREDQTVGVFTIYRDQAGGFTDRQVELVKTFADQAAIAVENARLFDEVQAKTRELEEALTYQTGSSNILGVIASSPTDVAPVLEAIVKSACELCDAYDATVALKDGDDLRFSAHHGPIPIGLEKWPINRNWTAGRAFLDQRPVHVRDLQSDEDFPEGRELSLRMGHRSILSVPLLREGESIGAIVLRRTEVQPFSDKQIALLQTFADQAVIAIGNVHLFEEVQAKTRDLSEALQQQTATADVLKVISRSAFDLDSVLNTLIQSGAKLCEAPHGVIWLRRGDKLHLAAHAGYNQDWVETARNNPVTPDAEGNTVSGRVAATGKYIHLEDITTDESFKSNELHRMGQYRAALMIPLIRDGKVEGTIGFTRLTKGRFTQRQIELVETFADQAVIAIENARLFDEVQAKTRELEEALTYQTGSANILSVIASSPTDVGPVLTAIVESACELCEADDATVVLRDGEELVFGAQHGSIPVVWQRLPINRRMVSGRAVIDGKPVHLHDLLAPEGEQFTDARELARRTNVRTVLSVPLLRENEGVGAIVLRRTEVQPFSDKQIALLQTFADQAVIAIGNVRLFEEVQAKTRELEEALTYQTGSGNILRVIASSPTDVGPVLDAIVESASELCEAYDAVVLLKDGDELRFSAHHGPLPINIEKWPISRGWTAGRAFLDQKPVHVRDLLSDEDADFPDGRELSRIAGLPGSVRTILSAPLLREKESIGAILLRRTEVQPFSEKQIALLKTFADQAVIAIGNVRLFDEVQQRTRELSQSLDDLRTAQDRLVQTEKLASLGQLTAGIAHEIKNPLNFVNNFSALSAELTDELNDVLKPAALNDKLRQEVDELTRLLKDNLEKVVQHGKRADSIVKNMLLHSREGSGEHRPTDINALLDESLNLAYHGARAEKREFNVTLQRDFDEAAGAVDLFPQEITRAFLNLISNGFYAANKRKIEVGSAFEPVLHAATRGLGDNVEIRIRDNGTGIPPEVKEKMFNPFFTTKPAGEGTGLGLSMSHDIIVKQHGGTIDVDSEPGEYTEFRIVLPRTSNIANKARGQT